MSWTWSKLDEEPGGSGVVSQVHEFGCGAACAAMLLADRGILVDQLVVSSRLHLPCTAQELAQRLNELSARAHQWLGGQLDLDPPLTHRLLTELGRHGSWAAQFIPQGRQDGHWVVINGMRDDMRVAVRDPIGSRYSMPIDEVAMLLRFMVVVFETGANR